MSSIEGGPRDPGEPKPEPRKRRIYRSIRREDTYRNGNELKLAARGVAVFLFLSGVAMGWGGGFDARDIVRDSQSPEQRSMDETEMLQYQLRASRDLTYMLGGTLAILLAYGIWSATNSDN